MHRCLFLVIVLSLVGGHVAGLQLVAWAGMVITRAPTSGISSAVRSTFSGQDPCGLCHVVRALAGADEVLPTAVTPSGKSVPQPDDKKQKRPDLSLSTGGAGGWTPVLPGVWQWPLAQRLAAAYSEAPEPPPPRFAAR